MYINKLINKIELNIKQLLTDYEKGETIEFTVPSKGETTKAVKYIIFGILFLWLAVFSVIALNVMNNAYADYVIITFDIVIATVICFLIFSAPLFIEMLQLNEGVLTVKTVRNGKAIKTYSIPLSSSNVRSKFSRRNDFRRKLYWVSFTAENKKINTRIDPNEEEDDFLAFMIAMSLIADNIKAEQIPTEALEKYADKVIFGK